MTHHYPRRGTSTLFAALRRLAGAVSGDCMPPHRPQEFSRFLKRLEQETPGELDLPLIVEHAATHKSPRLAPCLPCPPRFHLHFTPPSCSWRNLLEPWFRNLPAPGLPRGSFHNLPELTQAIGDYLRGHNQNPRRFVWSASVERIPTKLAQCKEALDVLP